MSTAPTYHATNIITGLAVSLQATALPAAMITADIWIAYSVGGRLFGVAVTAAAMGNDWPRTWASTSASSV